MAWTKEQQQAIDEKGKNIIVSAGAGSGKTAVLTARTMRILEEGTHINELLVLTFTSAAANEMKERIRKSIKKSIPTNPSLKDELDLLDQSYITTFDSFALSIVKKYHYLLNISNNISITDSSIIEMQKQNIVDEVFEEFYSSNNENFEKLISDFCVKNDTSIREYIIKIASKIDGLTNREEYLDNYEENYLSNLYIEELLKEYNEILLEKIKEIKSQLDKLLFIVDGDYETKVVETLTSLFNSKTIDEIYNNSVFIKLPSLPRGSEDEVKEAKDNLKSSIDELKDIVTTYMKQDDIINNIKESHKYIRVILELVKSFITKLHKYKRENEIYDFQDIALLSTKILRDNESVREELKYSFKQIMVDEYQDTNDIQETFISMIENNNVYMVGDIKQSIYRFRNANPYIFKNKYDKYARHENGIKIDLVKNFRSRSEVLNNINEIFNLIMDDIVGNAEYHESHQMVYGNTSYIEEGKTNQDYNMEILEYNPEDTDFTKEEIEIFTIAKDIKDKINNKYQVFDKDEKVLKDITYNDFVILIDRTTDFELYKKIFEYLGIPLTLYKDETLNNNSDIYVIKNIIDFIIKINKNEYDKKFKYDFISIARSFLYNLSDQEIFEYFKNNSFKESIIYKELSEISNSINYLSIKEVLEHIITTTNMYEKLITINNIDSALIRINKLIDIADNLSNLGYDIYTFGEYLNNLIDKEYDMKYSNLNTNNNSVKIMTIHKSKGLEYHICYYSGLYKKFNISDLKERFMIDNKYGIIAPLFNEGIKETMTKYLVKYHCIEEEISEKIRLFYVALTRAKECMIIINPIGEEIEYDLEENNTISLINRRKYRSFKDIMDSIKFKLPKYYKEIDLSTLNLTKDYIFKKNNNLLDNNQDNKIEVNEISVPNELVSKEHFSKKINSIIEKDTYNNIKLGLQVHEILEYIDFINPNYDLIDDTFIKSKVDKFLNNPILSNIKDSNIYKEFEFIYQLEDIEYHGIIDLMVEYDSRIDIIDYKLNNIKDDNYLKQLNGYKTYIEKTFNKEVNIYLYSIIGETLEKL